MATCDPLSAPTEDDLVLLKQVNELIEGRKVHRADGQVMLRAQLHHVSKLDLGFKEMTKRT